MTWDAVRRDVERRLASGGIAAPAAEAGWIVAEVSGHDPTQWFEIADAEPTARAVAHVDALTARRLAGEPLQYVLGSWSFRGLDLMVDERVLIPRPETEVVVAVALEEAGRLGIAPALGGRPLIVDEPVAVADLGTGSAAIALALAVELAGVEVWGVDVSSDALAVARANVAGNAVANVRLVEGDWFDALPQSMQGTFALVVSNPPYVAEHEVPGLEPQVADHEPAIALVAGPSGAECLDRIIRDAPAWLRPGGVLVCEIAPALSDVVLGQARAAGFESAEVKPDLTGRPRALVARLRLDA